MNISNFKLYQIANEYERAIEKMLDNPEPDQKALDELQDAFEKKSINVAKYIKNLEAEAEGVEKVISDMKERVKKIEAHKDSLTAYLKFNIESIGLLDPIKTPEFVIKVVKNPVSLVIDKPESIPDVYKVVKEVISFDKVAIKKDIQEGFEIEGARIEQRTRLEIK